MMLLYKANMPTCQHAQYQRPETEAEKWNSFIFTTSVIYPHRCLVSHQEKGPAFIFIQFIFSCLSKTDNANPAELIAVWLRRSR